MWSAKPIGKIAQFVTVLSLVLCFFRHQTCGLGHPIHICLLWLGVGLSIAALLYYAWLELLSRFVPVKKNPGNPGIHKKSAAPVDIPSLSPYNR